MKNVFITGATSFIGVNLIDKLVTRNYNIIAIIRPNSKNKYKLDKYNIKIIELNNNDIVKLPELINEKCDIFFHLSWDGTRGSTRDNVKLQEQNYLNSIKALETAKKMGCEIFVSSGSQAEYGLHEDIVSEDTKCIPTTEYGKNKYEFFKYAKKYCKDNNIRFKEPRYFSLYGVGDTDKTLIISTIKKMLNNEDIDLTKCIQLWNFMYISDACDALVKLVELECSDGAYNFGTSDTRVLKDFIKEMYILTKSKSRLNFGKVPYHDNQIINVNPSIKKLENELNWKEKVSFSEGIQKIIKNELNNR